MILLNLSENNGYQELPGVQLIIEMQIFQNQFYNIFFLMNFYLSQANEGQQRQIQSHFYAIYRQFELQHLLKTLSHALQRSLNSYSQQLQELKQADYKAIRQNNGIFTDGCVEIVVDSGSEHIQDRQNKAYITDQIQSIVQAENQRSLLSPMGNHQLSQKSPTLRTTSDQFPEEELQIRAKHNQNKKKITPKTVPAKEPPFQDRQNKKSKGVFPEINLLDECTLPSFHMSLQQLKIKKENLLRRQIDCWPELQRTARHKRQLRNLQ